MTTSLNRAVKREASDCIYSGGRNRAVIIELQPPGAVIGFRLKGTRRTYYLSVRACFVQAAKQAHDKAKADRKKERELRRKANRRV